MLAFNGSCAPRKQVLIVGTGRLAALRTMACLEADYAVSLAYSSSQSQSHSQPIDSELESLLERDLIEQVCVSHDKEVISWIHAHVASLAFVVATDSLLLHQGRSKASMESLSETCRDLRVPVNVSDQPALSDFTFPSTHRFASSSDASASVAGGKKKMTSLQLAVASTSSACRLSSRIKRQAVASLPREVGQAVDRISWARQTLKQGNNEQADVPEDDDGGHHLNRPVAQRTKSEEGLLSTLDTQARLRFVAQMCMIPPSFPTNHPCLCLLFHMAAEYWPFSKLANLTPSDLSDLLELAPTSTLPEEDSRHALAVPQQKKKKGHIVLLGAGTGSPALLTRAAHALLTSHATLILSDKLVPADILSLIPPHIPSEIAKKFPGNAEGAQSELISRAIDAAHKGHTVVRLKQGDVYLYGRGGEEVVAFRNAGFEPLVIPGLSSVLAGPTMAGIPVTQRGVAESLTVCTGVGRGGQSVRLPPYERARTLVVLMGVARLQAVVETLTSSSSEGRDGAAYPTNTPIAVIERASSPDQRVIATTLDRIVDALQHCGEQRPPAMMVIGWAVLALDGQGDMSVLDDHDDQARISRWLGDRPYIVKDGLADHWAPAIEGIV